MSSSNYSFLPDRAYFRELTRPWKLTTFCVAMILLIYGSFYFKIADWDVGVTILMGLLTYVMSPWSVYVIINAVRYRPEFWFLQILAAIVAGLFVVDWAYMIYHSMAGNVTYRAANFYASTPLYYMAGTFWLYRGSLRDLAENIKKIG